MDVRFGLWRKLSADELMLLNCGVGEDSWDSLGLQGDPTSPSWWRSVLGVQWKDWCWSWNSSSLATSWEVLTHWKRPLPESSSSSQGISLKWWVVLVDNDVDSDSRYRNTCLFQASGFLLYFDKSIRSEVWHFQFSPPRFTVSRNHCCPTNRVPASAILSESALLLSTSSYLSYT